jgi:predicted TIM-barrel fold metal-dependent hydrolase
MKVIGRHFMARTYNVVDADGHILEPLNLWLDYIDPAYRDRAPRLITNNHGRQQLQVDAALLGSAERGLGAIGAIGARDGHVIADGFEYSQGRPGGFDPHKRIPDMDMDGIDAAFLYPSIGLFVGGIQDPGLAGATCRAYNRWLADYCKPYPDRLFGVAMLPMQDVDQAIEEMTFARKELGFRRASCGPTLTTTG